MPTQGTIINKFGKMAGWNSITTNILGRDLEGITKLAYSDETDKKNFNGAGGFPVGRGDGNTEAKASFSLYKEEVNGLLNALPPGGRLLVWGYVNFIKLELVKLGLMPYMVMLWCLDLLRSTPKTQRYIRL